LGELTFNESGSLLCAACLPSTHCRCRVAFPITDTARAQLIVRRRCCWPVCRRLSFIIEQHTAKHMFGLFFSIYETPVECVHRVVDALTLEAPLIRVHID